MELKIRSLSFRNDTGTSNLQAGANSAASIFPLSRVRLSFSSAQTSSGLISGAAVELSGNGIGGANMSGALKTVNSSNFRLPIATVAGDVASIENLMDFSAVTKLLHLVCDGSNDPLVARYTSAKFDTVFDPQITASNPVGGVGGRRNDGAVPLTSALMDPLAVVCSSGSCFAGYAHGAGTVKFFSIFAHHLVDTSQVVSQRVEQLLNSAATEAGTWK